MIVPLADHEAEGVSTTGTFKQSQSEPDWSEEDFAAYSSLGSELLAPATAIPHELIGEEISPPPLSLSSSSASEKDTPPVPSSTLELRKVRSNPPRGSASQGRPRRSSSVIVNDQPGGSSRISKSSANKPWPKDLAKNAPHPNQHVHAQERAKSGPHILKTIFVHRKTLYSESFTGITYTPITLSTLNPADLIGSLCRTFAIDPGSIGAISMWHDPHNGVHGMVDEMFLATLSNDQDIVFDLCCRHGKNPTGRHSLTRG